LDLRGLPSEERVGRGEKGKGWKGKRKEGKRQGKNVEFHHLLLSNLTSVHC